MTSSRNDKQAQIEGKKAIAKVIAFLFIFDTMKTEKEIEKQKAATETKIIKVKGKKIAIGKFGTFGSVRDIRC